MTDRRRDTGQLGEDAAASYLCAQGCEIVERNARTRYGELDLIALDGATLVFVEVKALRGRGRGRAEQALESIGPRKRIQVRRLARAWLADRPSPARPPSEQRFDAIGVALAHGEPPQLIHVPAAF